MAAQSTPKKAAPRKAAAARLAKPTARQAFDDNMSDARFLFGLAQMLKNDRKRRMRPELREKVGSTLRIARRDWPALECIENEQVFVAFKPGAGLAGQVDEIALRPLLRQSVVAACAAVETFVADRVIENYGNAMRLDPKPPRLLGLTMTVEDWMRIESTYTRRGWGLRQIVELEIRERASPTPSVVGELFSMVAVKDVFKKIDNRRSVTPGTSARELDDIRKRRNKIAHEGDRSGRGRASITVPEVKKYLGQVESIIDAMDVVTKP